MMPADHFGHVELSKNLVCPCSLCAPPIPGCCCHPSGLYPLIVPEQLKALQRKRQQSSAVQAHLASFNPHIIFLTRTQPPVSEPPGHTCLVLDFEHKIPSNFNYASVGEDLHCRLNSLFEIFKPENGEDLGAPFLSCLHSPWTVWEEQGESEWGKFRFALECDEKSAKALKTLTAEGVLNKAKYNEAIAWLTGPEASETIATPGGTAEYALDTSSVEKAKTEVEYDGNLDRTLSLPLLRSSESVIDPKDEAVETEDENDKIADERVLSLPHAHPEATDDDDDEKSRSEVTSSEGTEEESYADIRGMTTWSPFSWGAAASDNEDEKHVDDTDDSSHEQDDTRGNFDVFKEPMTPEPEPILHPEAMDFNWYPASLGAFPPLGELGNSEGSRETSPDLWLASNKVFSWIANSDAKDASHRSAPSQHPQVMSDSSTSGAVPHQFDEPIPPGCQEPRASSAPPFVGTSMEVTPSCDNTPVTKRGRPEITRADSEPASKRHRLGPELSASQRDDR